MKFRPCIDLHDGKVKQIVGSSLTNGEVLKTNFSTDLPASHFAERFKQDQLKGGHVISLGSGNTEAAKLALTTYPGGLQMGGGINDTNAREWLLQGASGVIVTSFLFSESVFHPDKLEKLSQVLLPSQLIIDLSCRKIEGSYWVMTDRWKNKSNFEITEKNLAKLKENCFEFLIHAVEHEGKQAGIDQDLLKTLGDCSPLPIVYAGGISSLEDLEIIKTTEEKYGKTIDFTVGSSLDLFGGTQLKYGDLVKFC